MSSENGVEHKLSQLSLSSHSSDSSTTEDWDTSVAHDVPDDEAAATSSTPRNSVFLANGDVQATPRSAASISRAKRSLQELMRQQAERTKDSSFSSQEAAKVAELLGQWINNASSPYEGEDDFFSKSKEDLHASLPPRRSPLPESMRQRKDSSHSRPPSSLGVSTA